MNDQPIITSDHDLLAQVVEVEVTGDQKRVNDALRERHDGDPRMFPWGLAYAYLLSAGGGLHGPVEFTIGWIPARGVG